MVVKVVFKIAEDHGIASLDLQIDPLCIQALSLGLSFTI